MVPSSRMISQITPLGLSPARRETSTAASVWPARTSTPPGLATSGKTWPGETIASGPLAASIATAMVRARSAALIPVVIPSRASIETVKAVSIAAAVGAGHRLEPELVGALLGQREADQAAAVAGHEVDRVGRRHLRRDDEVALILAVFVVDEDEHAAVARLVDDLLGPDQHLGRCRAGSAFRAGRACRRSGSSRAAPSLRRRIGMKPGGAGEAGAADLAGCDDGVQPLDQGGAHARHISHCDVMKSRNRSCSYCARAASIRSI